MSSRQWPFRITVSKTNEKIKENFDDCQHIYIQLIILVTEEDAVTLVPYKKLYRVRKRRVQGGILRRWTEKKSSVLHALLPGV